MFPSNFGLVLPGGDGSQGPADTLDRSSTSGEFLYLAYEVLYVLFTIHIY